MNIPTQPTKTDQIPFKDTDSGGISVDSTDRDIFQKTNNINKSSTLNNRRAMALGSNDLQNWFSTHWMCLNYGK